jgi:hypothetical protein
MLHHGEHSKTGANMLVPARYSLQSRKEEEAADPVPELEKLSSK